MPHNVFVVVLIIHFQARTQSWKDSLGRGLSPRRQRAAGEKFLGDRLGYPAISMNFKTESFTYVTLLIFTHFLISLTFNFLMKRIKLLTSIIYYILQI